MRLQRAHQRRHGGQGQQRHQPGREHGAAGGAGQALSRQHTTAPRPQGAAQGQSSGKRAQCGQGQGRPIEQNQQPRSEDRKAQDHDASLPHARPAAPALRISAAKIKVTLN